MILEKTSILLQLTGLILGVGSFFPNKKDRDILMNLLNDRGKRFLNFYSIFLSYVALFNPSSSTKNGKLGFFTGLLIAILASVTLSEYVKHIPSIDIQFGIFGIMGVIGAALPTLIFQLIAAILGIAGAILGITLKILLTGIGKLIEVFENIILFRFFAFMLIVIGLVVQLFS